ncbi:hypothetical protein HJG60_009270 [Phyllostomus discolor]|uniref:Uncharacterized protein n=1 Tax=Phyllostomus discolor TaxID=89673 RepID=A0A833YKA4_9CHIR|nr:hypothetical protein HJG60_009270 [Phyllostomus discolor]
MQKLKVKSFSPPTSGSLHQQWSSLLGRSEMSGPVLSLCALWACSNSQVLTVQPKCQSEGVWSACQTSCLVASKALRHLETSRYYVLDFCWSPAFCGCGCACSEPAVWGLGISDCPGGRQWARFCRLPPVPESGVSRASGPPHFKLRSRLPACLSTWAHHRDRKSSPRARLVSFSSSQTF